MRALEIADQVQEELQQRVMLGDIAQRSISLYLRQNFPKLKIGRPKYAKPGGQGSDIIIKINDDPFVFEVKNRTTRHVLVQLYSETIHRGGTGNKVVRFLHWMGLPANFTQVIDMFRKKDKSIGFSGDPGVDAMSGKMPLLPVPNPKVLNSLRKDFIAQLQEQGVNYFALVTGNSETTQIFHTGMGYNPLNAPPLPAFMYARLDTAGAADSPRSIRACVKARLE